MTLAAPLGASTYDAATLFPDVVASSSCLLRATNNDRSTTATTAAFELIGDSVYIVWSGFGDPGQGGNYFRYASDDADANVIDVDLGSMGYTADTDAGEEGNNDCQQFAPNLFSVFFPDPLTEGGNYTLNSHAVLAFDRPSPTIALPQTVVMTAGETLPPALPALRRPPLHP